jgi:indolepyruvate ferredoxin oxidoreductase beta subunit
VISAALFGALAGSGTLPFTREQFEAVVERSGVGVQASLAALRAAAQSAATSAVTAPAADPMQAVPRPLPERAASDALQPLLTRIRAQFPRAAWDWLGEGLARVVDWQDVPYGAEYLDRVARFASRDSAERGHALTIEAARWIAVAMSYDDVIRVADLKTRAERAARLRHEVGASVDDVVGSEEYFHPRLPEVLGVLPRGLASWFDASPRLTAWLAPRLDRGRRIHVHTLRGHLQLRLVGVCGAGGGATDVTHEETFAFADLARRGGRALASDYALAVDCYRCRRLIKGYSDTHRPRARGFDPCCTRSHGSGRTRRRRPPRSRGCAKQRCEMPKGKPSTRPCGPCNSPRSPRRDQPCRCRACWRIAVSVVRDVITSGSSFKCSKVGRDAPRACANAASN